MNKKNIFVLGLLGVIAIFATTTVSADTHEGQRRFDNRGGAPRMENGGRMDGKMMKGERPVLIGEVSGISGTTLIVQSRGFAKNNATTTYSVNASNATVFSAGATTTLASVTIGDHVMIQGAISGTSVTATVIHDDKGMMGRGDGKGPMAFSGNGQPVVAGKVTAVNGTTITIKNEGNAIYTVNASNAKVMKDRGTGVIGDIVVGDNIVVQGVVSGDSVTATTIIDEKAPNQNTNTNNGNNPEHRSFFGSMKGFFGRVFGF